MKTWKNIAYDRNGIAYCVISLAAKSGNTNCNAYNCGF